MSIEERRCFDFKITETPAFKKCLTVFRRLCEPVPFRISKNGIKICQAVKERIYAETFWDKKHLLDFKFDKEAVLIAKDYPGTVTEGRENGEEVTRVFALDLMTIRTILTNIDKKNNIRIYQNMNSPNILVSTTRPDISGLPDSLTPINCRMDEYSTEDLTQLVDPSCTTGCRELSTFFKKISKQRTKLNITCHTQGFKIENEVSKSRDSQPKVNISYQLGILNDVKLFTREIDKISIRVILDMCSIITTGIINFFIDPEHKIIRVSTAVSFLGVIDIYILRSPDDEYTDDEDDCSDEED